MSLGTSRGFFCMGMRSSKVKVPGRSRTRIFRHFFHISGSRSERVKKAKLKLTVTQGTIVTRENTVGMCDRRNRKAAFAIEVPLVCATS